MRLNNFTRNGKSQPGAVLLAAFARRVGLIKTVEDVRLRFG